MRPGVLLAAVLIAGCGDDGGPADPGPFPDQLAALPGVHDVTEIGTTTANYHAYVVHFEQPVDHDQPDGPTFLQKVTLMHTDVASPMVEYTTGYWEYNGTRLVELTGLLHANQISIEHRFFDESRPDPADWSKLTIAQAAADQHAITEALRTLYTGAFVTAGASKGGMTAIYYRRFYPDDVEATVPYVAPISFGAPDTRYNAFLDTLGPADCRQAVRDAAVEMLANRRAALTATASAEATTKSLAYTRIPLDPAVESAVFNLEWSFWQYYGVGYCDSVPATTATDEDMWKFLDSISPVSDNADDRVAQFDAYYYQAYFQLGYPDGGAAYLDPYLMFTDADYLGALPTAQPTYDGGAAMMDIDNWVRTESEQMLFIYGQWDPWTGGKFQIRDATDSYQFVQAEGTHASRIGKLATADRDTALERLAAWTGVTPDTTMARSLVPAGAEDAPHVPPGLRRALTLSRRR